MCPCHGVTVSSAQVQMDLGAFFSNRVNQGLLVDFLHSQGITTHSWWKLKTGPGYSVAIGSLWTGVAFAGNEISISDEGKQHPDDAYQAHKAEVDRAYVLSALFVGQQIQANLIGTFAKMGLEPRDGKAHDDGSIEVRINLGSGPTQPNVLWKETVRVRVDLSGNMKLVTENGAFDVGKRKLALLLGLLGQQSGMQVTPSNEYETHRHDEQQIRVDQQTW